MRRAKRPTSQRLKDGEQMIRRYLLGFAPNIDPLCEDACGGCEGADC